MRDVADVFGEEMTGADEIDELAGSGMRRREFGSVGREG